MDYNGLVKPKYELGGGAQIEAVTIDQIEERLKLLPPAKLAVVFDFVTYLAERQSDTALQTMLASEAVLRRDWERPEEEAAWARGRADCGGITGERVRKGAGNE